MLRCVLLVLTFAVATLGRAAETPATPTPELSAARNEQATAETAWKGETNDERSQAKTALKGKTNDQADQAKTALKGEANHEASQAKTALKGKTNDQADQAKTALKGRANDETGEAETAGKGTPDRGATKLPPCPGRFDPQDVPCEVLSPEMERRFWLWSAARNWTERERQRAERHAPRRHPTWPASLEALAETRRATRAELDSSFEQGERERWIESPVCRVPDAPMHQCGVCAVPESLVRPRSRYPAEGCRAGIQGVEIYQVVIDERGHVRVDERLKGLPGEFEAESRRVLELSLFLPALHCGQPVEVFYNMTVNYKLSDGCRNGEPIE